MEWVLIIILGLGNVWQATENGTIKQQNVQLRRGLSEQSEIVESCYAETRNLEDILIKTQGSIRGLAKENSERAIELEKLRNSDSDTNTYLSLEVPSELVKHLSTYSSDKD